MDPWLPIKHPGKTLIRPHGYADRSESSQGAHDFVGFVMLLLISSLTILFFLPTICKMVIYGRRMMFLILSLKYIQYGDCNETEKRNNDK